MEEMVEPDRTIMIVSIIGLVIIWGSVLYHKFVQGGSPAQDENSVRGVVEVEGTAAQVEGAGGQKQRKKKR